MEKQDEKPTFTLESDISFTYLGIKTTECYRRVKDGRALLSAMHQFYKSKWLILNLF